jgi:hypothetical protein
MADWIAAIPDAAAWAAALAQPYDDCPSFDPAASPEVNAALRMGADRAFSAGPTRRLFADCRANPAAFAHLEQMPAAGESLHGVISGRDMGTP